MALLIERTATQREYQPLFAFPIAVNPQKLPRVSAPLAVQSSQKMKLYRKFFFVWLISNSGPPPHAVASSSACLEPQQGAEAQRRKPPPSKRQDTWGMSGISYLIGIYTGVGGWGKQA